MNHRKQSHHRKRRGFLLATLLVILTSVGSGLAHGWLDGRWALQPDKLASAARLEQLPQRLGSWVLLEQQELPASAAKMLQCYGYSFRTYQNEQTGGRINVAVLFGPRGPIAVHTPEICYTSRGTSPKGDRTAVAVGDGGDKLWKLEFINDLDALPTTEVYYAWSDGGVWQAAEQPRFWMTDDLYKIQLAGKPAEPGQESESEQFLALLLPQLRPLLEAP